MASIYDFTISLFVSRNIPPDKRLEPMLSWVTALLSPLQWMQRFYLDWFINGKAPANYSNVAAYDFGDTVYHNNKVWFFWNSKNNGQTGVSPTDVGQNSWFYVMDGKYGVKQRINISGSKIVLEYILNDFFGTTFRQPEEAPLKSDIYIEANTVLDQLFRVYDGVIGTAVFDGTLNSSAYVYDGVPAITTEKFTIYVPTSLWTSLGLLGLDQEKKIKSTIAPYVYAGITFNAEPY